LHTPSVSWAGVVVSVPLASHHRGMVHSYSRATAGCLPTSRSLASSPATRLAYLQAWAAADSALVHSNGLVDLPGVIFVFCPPYSCSTACIHIHTRSSQGWVRRYTWPWAQNSPVERRGPSTDSLFWQGACSVDGIGRAGPVDRTNNRAGCSTHVSDDG